MAGSCGNLARISMHATGTDHIRAQGRRAGRSHRVSSVAAWHLCYAPRTGCGAAPTHLRGKLPTASAGSLIATTRCADTTSACAGRGMAVVHAPLTDGSPRGLYHPVLECRTARGRHRRQTSVIDVTRIMKPAAGTESRASLTSPGCGLARHDVWRAISAG